MARFKELVSHQAVTSVDAMLRTLLKATESGCQGQDVVQPSPTLGHEL